MWKSLNNNNNNALDRREDIDKLYVSRKERGSGHANIEDGVDASIRWPEDYIKKKDYLRRPETAQKILRSIEQQLGN